ncbi:MAG: alkaline phosphatase family protein [Ginsengibacter sp.]
MKLVSTLLLFSVYSNITFAQSQPQHIVILVLENRAYNQIVGNSQAPYINGLLSNVHTALFTESFGLTHPSQPNYLMLYSGDNQGITNNNLPQNLPFTTLNLGGSLINQGFGFTGYSEGLPSVGSNVATYGSYARKHNPWVNWQGTSNNGIPSSSNRPFTDFPVNFNLLPTLSFVIPDLDHDMHDGSIGTGDTWIQNNLDAYIQWCVNNNSLFILTFDEDDGTYNNQILSFFIGSDIKGGTYNQPITHYNILRTLEEIYQLPFAGASADSSAVNGIWLSQQSVTYTFSGNGNWNYASNWLNNLIPPMTTGSGSNIIINHSAGGQCVLNIPYNVTNGTKLTVMPGKKLVVSGRLTID